MSVWLEIDNDKKQLSTSAMCDVSFRITCCSLPIDHAADLAQSLCQTNQWLHELHGTGIHPIHVAGSQNGWQRPDNDDQLLLLSKRTRLKIRIDTAHTDQLIASLNGTTHRIAEHELQILDGNPIELRPAATLFSRYTVYLQDQPTKRSKGAITTASEDIGKDEEQFVRRVISDCEQLGFAPTKVLCGRSLPIATTDGPVIARSILLADVPREHSLSLQERGLGDLRLMGCGIVIPHKDTGAVNQE
jgi:CRISPR-associated protein Cas6